MVIKKILFCCLFLLIINSPLKSSQILDFETETFIKDIISEIISVNNINREITFKILSDSSINAYVNQENVIHITSGLIEYSPDYVALLAVLAHEIGHIDSNHINLRKNSLKKIESISNLTSLSIIAGSIMSGNPDLLQGTFLSSAGKSNLFLNFSKEQEIEADYYAINTMSKLNIYSESVVKLLSTIEEKIKQKGFNEENQRYSTHPYFKDRIHLQKLSFNNKNNNINIEKNHSFNFIKAKFAGYNNNFNVIEKLEKPYIDYANLIINSKNGDLVSNKNMLLFSDFIR